MEPIEGSSDCQLKIKDFVVNRLKQNVSLLKFSNGFLGRYALSRLFEMEVSSMAGHDGCWSVWTPTISHACLHVGCPSRRGTESVNRSSIKCRILSWNRSIEMLQLLLVSPILPSPVRWMLQNLQKLRMIV